MAKSEEEQAQDQKIQELTDRVNHLELRLKAITESLSTLMIKESTELMTAVAGLKVYKAEVVTDNSELKENSFHCKRVDGQIEITCGDKPVELERMPPTAQRAMEAAFATVPSTPSFYVNLFVMG